MTALRHPLRALIALAVAYGATSCGGVCGDIADYQLECGRFKGQGVNKSEIVARCDEQLGKDAPHQKALDSKECAESASDCKSYIACEEEKRVLRDVHKIRQSIEKGEPGHALQQCKRHSDTLAAHDDLRATCFGVAIKALETYVKKNTPYKVEATCQLPWVKRDKELAKRCGAAFRHGLETALKDDRLFALKSACQSDFAAGNEAAKDACEEVLGRVYKDLTTRLVAVRDGKGEKQKVYVMCSNLKKVAGAIGAAANKKAQVLCREAEVGAHVAEAKSRVADELKKERMTLPWACEKAMKRLQELVPSPWQKAARAEIVRACYVDLAGKVLAAEVPSMRFCKYRVQKVLEGIRAYKVVDPSLTGHVAAAKLKCKE